MIPVIEGPVKEGAIKLSQKTIEVDCPYCPEIHTHGFTGEESHRVAHCKPNKVFTQHKDDYKQGYFIKPIQ